MARAPLIDESPSHLLHRAGQCADSLFEAQVKDSNLTPRQLAVLIAVARSEGPNQTELVERTGIDRSTLSDVVRRLQGRRLLQRRRTKEDARAFSVRLTDEGRRALRKVEPIARRIDERVLAALTNQQRRQLVAALQKIVGSVRTGSPKAD